MKSKKKVILVVIALVLLVSAVSTYLIVYRQKKKDTENKIVEIVDESTISLSTNHIILEKKAIGQTQTIAIKSLRSMAEIDCQVQFSTMTKLQLEEYIAYEIKNFEIKFVCSQPFADPIILTVSDQENQCQCQIDCVQDVRKLNVSMMRNSYHFLLDSSKRMAIPLCQDDAVYELDVIGEYDTYSLARDCPVQCHLYLANEVQAALTQNMIQYQVQYDFAPQEGLNLTTHHVQEMFHISKDVDWNDIFNEDYKVFILEIEMGSFSELYPIYYKEQLPIDITSIVLSENNIIF